MLVNCDLLGVQCVSLQMTQATLKGEWLAILRDRKAALDLLDVLGRQPHNLANLFALIAVFSQPDDGIADSVLVQRLAMPDVAADSVGKQVSFARINLFDDFNGFETFLLV